MISPDLAPDQKIYRFVNFCDLYNLCKRNEIRFTTLHKLDDKNEGLGKVLRSFELSPAFPTKWEHLENVEYPITRQTTYVSCWTTDPDNIAMWMLYSPDKSGMRITTTASKLHAAMDKYKRDYLNKADRIEGFHPDQIDVFGMDYQDLRKVKSKIGANVTAAHTAMREAIKGKSGPGAGRAWYKTMREHLKDFVLENDAMKYKDKNYFHEQEVRGQIQFETINEAADEDGPDDPYDYLLGCDFEDFADVIWFKVDEDFIEEICIDPRCLGYNKKVFKEIIGSEGKWAWVKSEAFGEVLKSTPIQNQKK